LLFEARLLLRPDNIHTPSWICHRASSAHAKILKPGNFCAFTGDEKARSNTREEVGCALGSIFARETISLECTRVALPGACNSLLGALPRGSLGDPLRSELCDAIIDPPLRQHSSSGVTCRHTRTGFMGSLPVRSGALSM
jgi:hypothetical protein